MRLGVAETFLQKTVKNLQTCFFSINMDEATSNNRSRVLAILISYFHPILDRVVVEHLASLSITKVTSISVFNAIDNFFTKYQIPYVNLMSILMDSCRVMRGSKNGVEIKLKKERAPHLLDIDGDICHHVHNAAQRFCKPFERWLEALFTTIHMDFYWSAELRDNLMRICELCNIKYTNPGQFINHRWLSAYDITVSTIRLYDVYTLFYYSFVPPGDRAMYVDIIGNIYNQNNISVPCRIAIKQIQAEMFKKLKTMTPKGKQRKCQVIIKILLHREKTFMFLQAYNAGLEFLKEYVCLFQSNTTMVHKLHVKQVELFKNFLTCFVKPEVFKDMSAKQLRDPMVLDLSNKKNLMPRKDIFIYGCEKCDSGILKNVLKTLKQGYVDCGEYLQQKLPLDNQLLESMVALNPHERGKHETIKLLKRLPKLAINVFSDSELKDYELEIRKYNVSSDLPKHVIDEKDVKLDIWWAAVDKIKIFPCLTKMAKALMSCFHGPSVESSFNIMGDILDPKSAAMKIPTFSAIQTVKYGMRAKDTTAVDMFNMNQDKRDADKSFARNIMTARTRLEKEREEIKKLADEKKRKLEIANISLISATEAKKLLVRAEKEAFNKHKATKLNKYRVVMEELTKKRKMIKKMQQKSFVSRGKPLGKSFVRSNKKKIKADENPIPKTKKSKKD